MKNRTRKTCTLALTLSLMAYPFPLLSAVPEYSSWRQDKTGLIFESYLPRDQTKEEENMIIKHPEQHMAALQSRLAENSRGSTDESSSRLFELIMNKNLASAPPSSVPSINNPIPSEVFKGKMGPDNTYPSQSPAEQKNNHAQGNNSGSKIRMKISPDTPRYTSNAVRQKIDFESRLYPDPEKNKPARESAESIQNIINKLNVSIDNPETIQGFGAISLQSAYLAHNKNSRIDELKLDHKEDPSLKEILARVQPFREHSIQSKPRHNAASAYMEHAAYKTVESAPSEKSAESEQARPGQLAARFESANKSGAIGYDHRGGTCYGIYQLSSRMGTMGEFIEFLDDKAPDISQRLRSAGPANTGKRTGEMPDVWQKIDSEQHERFAELQHEFIFDNFYAPAARGVKARTGVDMDQASPALREVLWSTAVQHGVRGSMNIFQRAANAVDFHNAESPDKKMIEAVYNERGRRFSGSTEAIRTAVQNRFYQEMKMALAMLPGSTEAQA